MSAFKPALKILFCLFFGAVFSLPLAAAEDAKTGDSERVLLFQADQVTFHRETLEVTAIGRVEVRHEGYRLNADTVLYNEKTGQVHAMGNVRISDPDGNVLYLDEARLDDELREGVIVNLRFVFNDGSRLAAKQGFREAGNRTTLNHAVFTPCKICDNHPGRPPSWQAKAVRVVHDQNKKRIYYRDVTLEIFGVPMAYLPFLSHPDPSVDRASGFLVPDINARKELGLVLTIPYHIVFSPSSDATITPIITTKEGLVLSGEYRRHFGFGTFQTQGSLTYVDERDVNNVKTGDKEFRGHIFANGEFDHSENVRTRVQFQLASDDTYLRRFGFSEVDTLKSEYRTEGFFGRSYVGLRSLWFQGLRVEDIQGLTGFALPLVNADYVSKPGWAGSVYRVNFNGLALHRTDGMDTRRISLSSSWEVPYTTSLGQKLKLGLHARGDIYHISNAARPDAPFFAGQDGTEGRFLPHLTASFRWPFLKVSAKSQQIIEPIMMLVAAPTGGNPVGLSNEDSRTFELTDTNILSDNRLPGLDQWEGGSRLNYGIRYQLNAPDLDVEALVAQSFRFQTAGDDPEDIFFSPGSGLSDQLSDLVSRIDVTLADLVRVAHHIRLDKDSFIVRRNEIDASLYIKDGQLGIGYFKLNRNRQLEGLGDREEIRIHGSYDFTENWRLFGDITRNLTTTGRTITQGLGVLYSDCCIEISFSWRRNFTRDRDIVPGHAIHFRISLKHLG